MQDDFRSFDMSTYTTLRRFARSIGIAWCIVGVSIIAVIAAETVTRLMFLVKDTWVDEPQQDGAVYAWERKDHHLNAWESEYWREFERTQMAWHSYVYWRRRPFQGSYINIDSEGIRNTWIDPRIASIAKSKRFRIFVFGGSTVWGTGARDEGTIPSCLAKILCADGLPVEVVNLGESGYVTTQELLALILRLQQQDIPNLVIFYDGINDTYSTFQNRYAGLPQNESRRRDEFNLLRNPAQLRSAYVKQIVGESYGLGRLAFALRRRLGLNAASRVLEDDDLSVNNDLLKETVRTYETNVRMVQSLADTYGFTACFFWQPIVYTKRHPTEFESREANKQKEFGEFCVAVYRQISLSDVLSHNNTFWKISSIFDDVTNECYIDFAHLTEEANEMVSKQMAVHVRPEIKSQLGYGINRPHSARNVEAAFAL
jgi:GDSL-like lipase/acylhydrolase family protein